MHFCPVYVVLTPVTPLQHHLACTLLLLAHETVDFWPIAFVQAYLQVPPPPPPPRTEVWYKTTLPYASVGLPDYSEVGMPGAWCTSGTRAVETCLVSQIRRDPTDSGRPRFRTSDFPYLYQGVSPHATTILSHKMYQLNGFRESTPPQKS